MAVGIMVACIPTLGPVFFPHRFSSSAQKQYVGKDRENFGSGTRVRLHSRQNDSFGRGRSLHGLEADDMDLGNFLRYGGARSHTFVGAAASTPSFSTHKIPDDGIGVRNVIEITSDLHRK